jgi:Fe-S cluster biogenesis protein NfuA
VRTADNVLDAIEEVAALLEADGARLALESIDEPGGRVELSVEFEDAACEECVLPPAALHDMIASALARRTGRAVALVLHDPRTAQGAGNGDQITVLDPTGDAPEMAPADPGPDAGRLAGRRIAIRHDILWQSFDWTVEEWTTLLRAGGAEVRTWRRIQGLVGDDYERAQGEYLALLSSSDVLISGLANCGSCTSWTVRDASAGVERGMPTVAVATAHFEPLARSLAADAALPGLRLMVLPYPYDTLPEDEVRRHARAGFARLLEVMGATV